MDGHIRRLLHLLEHGTRAQKIAARAELASICEAQGKWDTAAELYELNLMAGVREPELYFSLTRVYWHSGRYQEAHSALVLMVGQIEQHLKAKAASLIRFPIRASRKRLELALAALCFILALAFYLRPV
jgi:hypothetical protein